ncbi:hypothetical protein F183_A10020 [Bryobacterales bacterium F-183]|nr:hypothetical protein F183_A10020 [Bryobacterales bacterium F-183]
MITTTLFFAATLLAAPVPETLRKNLTFHASFDQGTGQEADLARGDNKIYNAPDYGKRFGEATPGFGKLDVAVEKGAGLNGGSALTFRSTNKQALFFRGAKHLALTGGTFSFWLRLDPARDLWPNYSDPLQLTDGDYNDRALWVDFSKDERPRWFRLGVFGMLKAWNGSHPEPDKNPAFNNRLIVVKNPPFSREAWTHVAITWSSLGTAKGTASLYVNGKLVPAPASVPDTFVWKDDRLAIRLGLNYTGKMDELAAFDRVLTEDEIGSIYKSSQSK